MLAERIAVIDHGRKIAEGTSRELKAAIGSGYLHVTLIDPTQLDDAARLLEARLGAPVQRNDENVRLAMVARSPAEATAALEALIGSGIEIGDFALGNPSLDEVFFALTGNPTAPNEASDDCCLLYTSDAADEL